MTLEDLKIVKGERKELDPNWGISLCDFLKEVCNAYSFKLTCTAKSLFDKNCGEVIEIDYFINDIYIITDYVCVYDTRETNRNEFNCMGFGEPSLYNRLGLCDMKRTALESINKQLTEILKNKGDDER